jgi:hypothetical protein
VGAPADDDRKRRAPAREVWHAWRPSVLGGLWTWIAGIAAYAMVTFVAWVPPAGDPPEPGTVLQRWNQWDTAWYTIIADIGYTFDDGSVAFFPLYPLLIKAVEPVLPGGVFEAAIILSALSALAVLILLHRLTTELFGETVARRATFYILAFPTGYYLVAAYNESLLIALSLGALYCMRRGYWAGAAILAAFASAARVGGIILVIPYLFEYLRQHDWSIRKVRADLLWMLIMPIGLLAFMAYQWRVFGNPLQFQQVQERWLRFGVKPPWAGVGYSWGVLTGHWPVIDRDAVLNIMNLTTVLGVVVLLVLAVVSPWRFRREQMYLVVYCAAMYAVPLCNPVQNGLTPLGSMWRYVLELPVIWIMLAKFGQSPLFDRMYLFVVLCVQGVMLTTFVHGEWVA